MRSGREKKGGGLFFLFFLVCFIEQPPVFRVFGVFPQIAGSYRGSYFSKVGC